MSSRSEGVEKGGEKSLIIFTQNEGNALVNIVAQEMKSTNNVVILELYGGNLKGKKVNINSNS